MAQRMTKKMLRKTQSEKIGKKRKEGRKDSLQNRLKEKKSDEANLSTGK